MSKSAHKEFADKVRSVVAGIRRGRVKTYKEVAVAAGRPRAWRAVGNILNGNRDPRVPCHRVVRSDGRPGGFNRGRRRKISLLRREAVEIRDGRVRPPKLTKDMRKNMEIRVHGRVQGVFFRLAAKEKALELGLTGIVRNEPDGSVFIETAGEEAALARFVDWCRRGPDQSWVKRLEVEDGERRDFTGFVIR